MYKKILIISGLMFGYFTSENVIEKSKMDRIIELIESSDKDHFLEHMRDDGCFIVTDDSDSDEKIKFSRDGFFKNYPFKNNVSQQDAKNKFPKED